jgi:hypothetical protein
MDIGIHLEGEGGVVGLFEEPLSGKDPLLALSPSHDSLEGEASIQEQEKGEVITMQARIPLQLFQWQRHNQKLRTLWSQRKLKRMKRTKPLSRMQGSHTRMICLLEGGGSVGDLEDELVDTEEGVEDLLGERSVGEIKLG